MTHTRAIHGKSTHKEKKDAHTTVSKAGPSNARVKQYHLDRGKALEKKIEACNRDHITLIPCDGYNFKIQFSTASFELARKALLSTLHLNQDNQRGSRKFTTYEVDVELSGLIVTDLIKIRRWQMIKTHITQPSQAHAR